MAVWQFELAFLSVHAAAPAPANHGFLVPPLAGEAMALTQPYIAASLGRPQRLAGGAVISFGAQEGNHIDLVEGEAGGCEVWAGIDARSDADGFCAVLCDVARALRCELFAPELGLRVEPQRRALVEALMRSTAWVYALDPSLFRQGAHGWMAL
ncbi:hypothetical protein [Pelomonas sp. KK5]|uniref:hypothetical protein n=1 Tax=Pelomonas sp. KK5 TaxID=1855730 RepID=UPI00097BF758|nr:hypothetical protein [Pelomonas sp. KK5]